MSFFNSKTSSFSSFNYHNTINNNIHFFARVLIYVSVYFVLGIYFRKVLKLPYEDYFNESITIAFVKNLATNVFSLVLLPILGLVIYCRKTLFQTWSKYSNFSIIKPIILVAAFTLTWKFTFYDYNLLFNQLHLVDRVFLFLLFVGIVWRPIFVLPFIILFVPIMHQFTYLEGFGWSIPVLPFNILLLFLVYFLIIPFSKNQYFKDFIFLFFCIFAASYFHSGVAKLNPFWINNSNIHAMIPVAYSNGWLSFLTTEQMVRFTEFIKPFNFIGALSVILIEAGSVAILFHKKITKVYLFGLILFHVGVLIFTGINFWVWVLIEISILWVLFKNKEVIQYLQFNKIQLGFFIALLFFSNIWSNHVKLFWYNLPFNYTYELYAETDAGETIKLNPNFFSPYYYEFAMGSFSVFQEEKLIQVSMGASNQTTSEWFKKDRSKEEIIEYEKLSGTNWYNERKKKQIEFFLVEYISNWNNRQSKKHFFSRVNAPAFIQSYLTDPVSNHPQTIKNIVVIEKTILYQNGQYSKIRERDLFELDIPE